MLEEMLVLPAAPTLALLCDPMHITAAARRGARRSLGGIADLLHLLKLAASVVLELCRYRHGAAAVATSTLPQALLFPAATARTLANGSWSLHFFLDAGADSEAPTHPYSHYADAQHVGVDALSRCLAVLPPGSDARHALACTVAQWACFSPLPVHTPAELVRAATALIALAVSIMQPAGACEPLVLGGVGTEGE